MSSWALDAAGDALLTRNGIAAQADEAAFVRTHMPPPRTAEWNQTMGQVLAAEGYVPAIADLGALEDRMANDHARAVELMNQYSIRSVDNQKLMNYWTPPPTVVVEAVRARRAARSGRDRDGCEPRRDAGRDGGAGCRCKRDGTRGRARSPRLQSLGPCRPGRLRHLAGPCPPPQFVLRARCRLRAVAPRRADHRPAPSPRARPPGPDRPVGADRSCPCRPRVPCPPRPQTRSPAVHRARPGPCPFPGAAPSPSQFPAGSRVRRQRASPRVV